MSKANRAINGFVAWCDEFVGSVEDSQGVSLSLSREWNEQLAFLRNAAVSEEINIPDIRSDADAVRVIDELKYRLKTRVSTREERPPGVTTLTPVGDSLEAALDQVIKWNNLDTDPHTLASLPKETT